MIGFPLHIARWAGRGCALLALSAVVRGADPVEVQKALLAGNYAVVIKQAVGELAESPGHPEWTMILVRAYLTVGRYTDAERVMKETLAREPRSVRLRWLAREVALANGQAGEAGQRLEEVSRAMSDRSVRYYYQSPADLVVFGRAALLLGVDPKDVTFVEAAFPQMPDLLKGGTVDAVTITEPMRSIAQNSGAGYVFADYVAEYFPDLLMVGYIATGDWAMKNPSAIKAFREAMDESIAFIAANKDETKAIEQKVLGFTSNAPAAFKTAVRPDDLDVYIAVGKELGLYRSALDPKKMIMN